MESVKYEIWNTKYKICILYCSIQNLLLYSNIKHEIKLRSRFLLEI